MIAAPTDLGRTELGSDGDPQAPLHEADAYAVARGIVLRQLTMAPRSRAELQAKLDAKQVPVEVSTAVLNRMEEVHLVDDAAFAAGWVRSRRARRGLSRRALWHELHRKGVDDVIATAAVETIETDDERRTAGRLVGRRLPSTRGLDHATRIRRLVAMLTRKGYPGGMALAVVEEALDAEDADAADADAHDAEAAEAARAVERLDGVGGMIESGASRH